MTAEEVRIADLSPSNNAWRASAETAAFATGILNTFPASREISTRGPTGRIVGRSGCYGDRPNDHHLSDKGDHHFITSSFKRALVSKGDSGVGWPIIRFPARSKISWNRSTYTQHVSGYAN
jgi:hypothetical protein